MSGPKHTPGPYEAKGDIVFKGAHPVAFVCHPTEQPNEERKPGETWLDMRERTEPQRAAMRAQMEATAQLLAAAPRLAEALKDLLAMHDSGVFVADPWNSAMEDARAALREAGIGWASLEDYL